MEKESYMMKMELKNMRVILNKINSKEKELNIMKMEIKNMKGDIKMVNSTEKG